MDFMRAFTDVNFWMQIIRQFQNFGPLGPILLAASESLFSFLPLVAIVAFHVGIYGELRGFLYSWLGTFLGSSFVFLIVRFSHDHILFLQRLGMVKKLRTMLQKEDLLGLFFVTSCAFMPSFFINVAYGCSGFDKNRYIKVIFFSKAIMVMTLVLFGSSIKKAFQQPAFLFLALFILVLLYVVSKQVKKKLQARDKTN